MCPPVIENVEPVSDSESEDDDVQEVEGPAPEFYNDAPHQEPAADQEVPEAVAQVSVPFPCVKL